MAGSGKIKTFEFYVPPFTGWFYDEVNNRVNLNELITGGDQATKIHDEDGLIGVQSPLPINILDIAAKDIDVSGSDIGGFSGDITDLVDDLDTYIEDDSATNPKYFEIKVRRPIDNASVKFCSPPGKDFSNVKIILTDRSDTTLVTIDESANNTKYSSNEYDWKLTAWCTIRVEFHTSDPVAVSWLIAEKILHIHSLQKFIDENNSTSTPLIADGIFTGEWINTLDYTQAIISVLTDQDAAEQGLRLELSDDAVNVRHVHTFNVKDNTPDGHHYPSTLDLKYFRVKYTNGGTGQGTFVLFTTLMPVPAEEGHVHSVEYVIDGSHPAAITRAIGLGRKPDGSYINFTATTGGNQKMSVEELETTVEEALRLYVAGTGSNSAVTLTNANTSYAIPAAAPTKSYRITMYNGSDTSIYIGYQNTNANGIELPPGDSAEDDIGANQQLYAYCASAGKVLTCTVKETI